MYYFIEDQINILEAVYQDLESEKVIDFFVLPQFNLSKLNISHNKTSVIIFNSILLQCLK